MKKKNTLDFQENEDEEPGGTNKVARKKKPAKKGVDYTIVEEKAQKLGKFLHVFQLLIILLYFFLVKYDEIVKKVESYMTKINENKGELEKNVEAIKILFGVKFKLFPEKELHFHPLLLLLKSPELQM